MVRKDVLPAGEVGNLVDRHMWIRRDGVKHFIVRPHNCCIANLDSALRIHLALMVVERILLVEIAHRRK